MAPKDRELLLSCVPAAVNSARRLFPSLDVEDLVQSAVQRAILQGAALKFENSDACTAYLLTVVMNIARNQLRRYKCRRRHEAALFRYHDLKTARARDPVDAAIHAEEMALTRAALERCLDALTPRQQEVMLHTIDGRSDREIAEMMSSSSTAVRSCRYEARKRIRRILELK